MTHPLTVRFYAGAAAAAGCEERTVHVAPTTVLADLLASLGAEAAALPPVLAASSFLLDATAARRDSPLGDATTLDVLPPFAGG